MHVRTFFFLLKKSSFQVTYLNHKHFGAARKKPKPSPVRIFTNLALPGFKLPSKEGYRMCKACNRYVAKMNAHCDKCGTCSSKVSMFGETNYSYSFSISFYSWFLYIRTLLRMVNLTFTVKCVTSVSSRVSLSYSYIAWNIRCWYCLLAISYNSVIT